MNKTIITIVAIAIVLVGGYLLFFSGAPQPTPPTSKPSAQQPPASQAPPVEENAVTYTDSGYAPIALNIKNGETVIFKNQSPQSMWTASAAHPTHRIYPTTGGCLGSTFDACAGVQLGGSWSFRFDIPGTWKYHNHLSPGDTGTIIVD